jgi:hypothetical protein
MEACAGAHFWARELQALGHDVRIMPPSYVKPYVKRGKTDSETGPWPQMRPRKPVERCRGDLRSGDAPDDALRAREVGGGEAPNAIRPREGPNGPERHRFERGAERRRFWTTRRVRPLSRTGRARGLTLVRQRTRAR